MADIELIKHHSLPLAAARALVQRTADDLGKEYHLVSHWTGNTLHFTRTGIQGQMQVTESEIRLEVTLGFLLKLLKSKFVEHRTQLRDVAHKAHATHVRPPSRRQRRAPSLPPRRRRRHRAKVERSESGKQAKDRCEASALSVFSPSVRRSARRTASSRRCSTCP
jgi:putative polyhydroxyalkanoate system protein